VTTPSRPSLAGRIEPARRRFLAQFGIASASLGAIVGSVIPAHAQSTSTSPRRHPVDDWMDALPSAHRMVFDAVSATGADDIRHYASNVFLANRTGYEVESRDVGVIVVLRHNATPFAYNDAMWAKYGGAFAAEMKIAETAPSKNPANGEGETLDGLSQKGAHFAVCAMATRRFAGIAAGKSGGSADAVFEELGKNLIANAHLTPAGIVAVGRAQERGFAFGYAG
jgi:intracellular sulfur oxidation DsrE/DsrF family protein